MAHVLIVDDDPLVLETLTEMMESAHFKVSNAADGKQALRQCRENAPDLVIMDMIMPEMEGLETIKQIRQHLPTTKIIAISGGGSLKASDYLDVARRLGADGTITKPCDRDQLVNEAQRLLGM